ncbi:MAG: histidine phosphatase family protein [Candidatus Omnitrophica bacterium]|nr:histidine phosphatase family protein [Candidatus Omnitrophota bacterium]
MTTTLYLIRHGITEWNIKKRYCGFYDIALSRQGTSQAKRLRRRLNGETIDTIYSSDRKRALQTARILFGKRKIHVVNGLREMHFGIFEGLTHTQILKKHGELYRKWLRHPFTTTIPKGEKLSEFRKRSVMAIQKIVSQNNSGTIAIVCHGGVISAFFTYLRKNRNFWKQIPSAASVSIVEYRRSKPIIKVQNDISHLNG